MTELLIRDARGPAVATLRKRLAEALGADAAPFEGLAGGSVLNATTEAAARRWQSGVGLVADGVVGPRCRQLLGLCKPQAMAVPLRLDTVRPLFPATKPANIDRYLPYVSAALQAVGLTDAPMICAALATIRAESEGFLPIAELPSQFNTRPGREPFSQYEGKASLGNSHIGDGARFKGRGFVQLTGRQHYQAYGRRLGVPLEDKPDLANAPEVASLLLAHCLADVAPALRQALAAGDWVAARKLVNGNEHGLERFVNVFGLAATVWPRTAAVAAPAGATRRRGAAAARTAASPTPAAAPAPPPSSATTSRPPLTARKDAVDLRDRPYQPPAINLVQAFPDDAEVQALLPRYSRAGLILDQGQEGACTGFGLACVINHLRWRKAGLPDTLESVSPRMLYNFARRYDEYSGEDYEGSSCRGALKGWFKHGVCLEADWPYGDPAERPRYGYARRAAEHTLGVYFRVELRAITDLQAAIQQVGAVYASAFTHAGWDQLPAPKRTLEGHADLPRIPFDGRPSQTDGHAFALVGYNRDGFVVQNSWGEGWGQGGFAVLSYADWLANGMDAWVAALGVPGVIVGRVGSAAPAAEGAGAATAGDTRLWWGDEQAYRHSVVLGNDGRLKRYLTEDELSRTLLHQVAGLPDQWFRRQAGPGPRRLVIYAHGGLNSEAAAITRARAMGRHFVANGCYPLFLVWKTGLLETIGHLLADAWRQQAPAGAGLGEWLSERTDLLIEKAIARPLARPVWSEMKENAGLAFESGRGGDLLITALAKLADTWGDGLQVHLVGHSAGAILLGHLLKAMAARQAAGLVHSVHLYAPACTVQFANRHYAPLPEVMQRLHLHVLSDTLERDDTVATVYRKSLLYLVSNALEMDLRTPLLGLANTFDAGYGGWDGTSSTGDTLRAWREAVSSAGLVADGRLVVHTEPRMRVSLMPEHWASLNHGGFDNDLATVTATLTQITGGPLVAPPDDLRGY
ncbi:C1 family peptidase [Pseudorhodoferax sp.]|uniref:C1 family peptidase n=1 Tax=Pseudorhodoferax sp. TaxID=1993553 RepID=UPI002DD6789F|nr:C1 family peptidase [Pseudorhodoferax sp.]